MNYLSVCSGIEAATTAWHHLGWKPVAFSEVEPFPSAVLAHHWPDTPNLGDMTKYESWNLGPDSVDLLVGGTPCQSFSVAGLRKGLRDPRGGLMLTYLEIAQRLRPRWVVWENVPGVLSSNGGRDFGAFLGALGDLGYGWAYRVLDAQWFGVAQRRRRVFVVGCLGDAASAAAVLFESESVRRDSPPSREKGQGTAGTPASRASAGGGIGTDFDLAGGLVPSWWDGGQVSQTLDAVLQKGQTMPEKNWFPAVLVPHLVPHLAMAIRMAQTGSNGWGINTEGMAYTLDSAQQEVAFAENFNAIKEFEVAPAMTTSGYSTTQNAGGLGIAYRVAPGSGEKKDDIHIAETQVTKTIDTFGSNPANHQGGTIVSMGIIVRRLTPVECERLQGFPDDHTLIPWRGKPADQCPDGPRYKALGNSMAVPVMRWIGERIQQQQQKTP